jgi:DNA-binding XRE family transcriptional regulator
MQQLINNSLSYISFTYIYKPCLLPDNFDHRFKYITMDKNNSVTEFKMRVGTMLLKERLKKNYSIQVVARAVEHSQSTISDIENGQGHFNLEIVAELAAYYGKSLDDILPPPLTSERNRFECMHPFAPGEASFRPQRI